MVGNGVCWCDPCLKKDLQKVTQVKEAALLDIMNLNSGY